MTGTSTAAEGPVELVVGGMSCAACAARIEKRLNLLDGVAATVNYATERAYITATGGRDVSELVTAIEATGYTATRPNQDGVDGPITESRARRLGWRLTACAPLAAAVVVLAMVPAAQFRGWQWVSLALALPVASWGAWPLHRAAWASLRHASATMDTLVSLGISASFVWSLYALTFGGAGMLGMRMPFPLTFTPAGQQALYLDVAAGVTVSVLTGRYLEARAKDRSGSALTTLAQLGAKTVAVLRDGSEVRMSAGALQAGEKFVVRPGEKIATDGIVVEGDSTIDASLLTGESVPAEVGVGDAVTGATVNMSGRLVVRATRVGAETMLAQLVSLVNQAQMSKTAAQRLADRLAAVFVPCVITMAVVTLGFWIGAGLPSQDAWSAAFAVLVVACPCALGLATPAALLAGVGRGAELGILVRGMQALEAARRIDVVVLDKTGTLTSGTMSVAEVIPGPGTDERDALLVAGAVEDASEHPVGQAIARAALARLGDLPAVTRFASLPGAGVTGTVGEREVTVGSLRLLDERGLAVLEELRAAAARVEDTGRTAVVLGWNGQARAVLAVADTVKPGSREAVSRIRPLGVRPVLVTGDNERTARAVAAQLAIADTDVLSGIRPDGKVGVVREFQAAGHRVAMVGDGVNDAAALAQADLGMAIGTGSDVAIGAADLTLVNGDPASIADALLLSRATLRVIHANLTWAFGYNLVAIPLAALGYLNPLFAGLAMAGSSLVVVSNSLRLRGFKARRSGSRPETSPGPHSAAPPRPSAVRSAP
jgi:P-type Cu+ transporter